MEKEWEYDARRQGKEKILSNKKIRHAQDILKLRCLIS